MGLNALLRETIHNSSSEQLYKHLVWLSRGNEKAIGELPPLYE